MTELWWWQWWWSHWTYSSLSMSDWPGFMSSGQLSQSSPIPSWSLKTFPSVLTKNTGYKNLHVCLVRVRLSVTIVINITFQEFNTVFYNLTDTIITLLWKKPWLWLPFDIHSYPCNYRHRDPDHPYMSSDHWELYSAASSHRLTNTIKHLNWWVIDKVRLKQKA